MTTFTPVHSLWLLDLLDIFLVAVLFYRLLILVRGTRSAQMYVGLLIIVVVGAVARWFDLIAVRWIADSLRTVWLIVFVILFQPELRHALAQFGRTRYFRAFLRGDNFGVLGEIVRGAETLAERRHGAHGGGDIVGAHDARAEEDGDRGGGQAPFQPLVHG